MSDETSAMAGLPGFTIRSPEPEEAGGSKLAADPDCMNCGGDGEVVIDDRVEVCWCVESYGENRARVEGVE